MPSAFHGTTDLVASELADRHLQFFGIDFGTCKPINIQQVRGDMGFALYLGGANPCPATAGGAFSTKPL